MSNTTGKRLAKNTAFMYIRMFVLMVVSFYTSRIVLQQLGVEDYGIYNLVGSIVAMLNSLRTIFATSTQRYLNYEMGQGNEQKLQLVYNLSVYINLIIAAIFILFVELLGIWFFEYKINVAPDRLQPAFYMFQCSVLIAAISIITSIFDAEIIAHEHMQFYAIMAIVESFIKLGIAYLLIFSPFDKLVFYGLLLLSASIITFLINFAYCKSHFAEVKLQRMWDKAYFKQMTAFAGWNFLGNTAYTVTQNGLNMILNVFGGPIVNAARGIAFQVDGMTKYFIRNVNLVIKPYCIQAYAGQKRDTFQKTIFISSKILFYIQLLLTIPLVYLTPLLINIWLGQVPEFSIVFLRLTLCISLIRSIHEPIETIFVAYGDIKFYQIAEGIILSSPLLFGYIVLKLGAPYACVFVCCIVMEIVNLIVILILANRVTGFNSKTYVRKVILPAIICLIFSGIGFMANQYISSMSIQILIGVLSMGICSALWWFIMLNKYERTNIKSLIPKSSDFEKK